MTYSLKQASAFNDTYTRSNRISPFSGMCSLCQEECDAYCEIINAAVLGARAVYPTNTGNNQIASEKEYPLDYSHFNINGRVFGAMGTEMDHQQASIHNVTLETVYGASNPIRLAMPVILPALIKMNWQDYFGGAAMAGVSCVIGEDARNKDPKLVIRDGKVVEFPALEKMLDAFRRYDRGYGKIFLQINTEDDMLGVPEYAVTQHACDALEFKFGQGAKGTQPVIRLNDRMEALAKQAEGLFVHPDPTDLEIIKADEEGFCPNFYIYSRLPLWDEEYLIPRFEELREMGVTNIALKMAGYDREDIRRVLRLGSMARVDMITFDGAGGGSGYSPCKMMNEWGLPTVILEEAVLDALRDMEKEGLYIPAIAMTGGFTSEDQVFKALAYGNNRVSAVGIGRAAMAAAMSGKRTGDKILSGETPKNLLKYGNSIENIFLDLPDLRSLYGREANDFSTGAIGVFSYLNKIAFGLKHFAALNRKFNINLLDQSDLIPLTRDAKELMRGQWFE